jgi:glycerate 2-kinase
MANLMQLRMAAREIFDEALRVVDAGSSVRRSVRANQSQLNVLNETFDIGEAGVYSIAIGKAAFPMAVALEDILGERLTSGVIAGPARQQERWIRSVPGGVAIGSALVDLRKRWNYFEAGHPLPTENSLSAAEKVFALLDRANKENALVIFLVSGGGSAMIELPIHPGITLNDLRAVNKTLVESGASIAEVNSVRRAFSAIKGGRLAARAPDCDQITLIVSDVPAAQEAFVASGPTLLPPKGAPDALEIIERYRLVPQIPAAGAIVDNTTIERAIRIGLDPQDFLDRSDAYSFFVALGDVITTGPTGTNVRDLRILLSSTERKRSRA